MDGQQYLANEGNRATPTPLIIYIYPATLQIDRRLGGYWFNPPPLPHPKPPYSHHFTNRQEATDLPLSPPPPPPPNPAPNQTLHYTVITIFISCWSFMKPLGRWSNINIYVTVQGIRIPCWVEYARADRELAMNQYLGLMLKRFNNAHVSLI